MIVYIVRQSNLVTSGSRAAFLSSPKLSKVFLLFNGNMYKEKIFVFHLEKTAKMYMYIHVCVHIFACIIIFLQCVHVSIWIVYYFYVCILSGRVFNA